MTLPIISADERLAEKRGIKGCIFGKSGIGKTSLLWTLPADKALFFDLEAGDLAIEGWAGDTIRPQTWQECRDFAVFIGGPNPALRDDQPYSQAHFDAVCERYGNPSALNKYDTVFVDSITVAGRLCFQWCKGQPQAFSDKTGNNRTIMNDNLGEGFEAFLYDACVNMLTVCKGGLYVCMSSSELHTLQKAFVAAGGKWSTFVIWAKNTFTLGRSDYQRQYEPILYGWKQGTDHFWCGARDQGDVWFVNKPRVNDLHPTMKPVELVERAIQNSSKSRDIVLDCFGGSGTTLIACEKTGRQARLIELDPKYCDVIVKRWEEFTGKTAERIQT